MNWIALAWTLSSAVGVIVGPIAIHYARRELRETTLEVGLFDNGRNLLAESQFKSAKNLYRVHWIVFVRACGEFGIGLLTLITSPSGSTDPASLRGMITIGVLLGGEFAFVIVQLYLLNVGMTQRSTRRKWDDIYANVLSNDTTLNQVKANTEETKERVKDIQEHITGEDE